MNLNFNLEYYKAFYYAARHQSFSRAAEALCLTQPTISQTIHRLEEDLNCALFYRTSHGMALTARGELLYSHVEKAFQLLEAGETKLARFAEPECADLFVGATETGLLHFILPRLARFQEAFPNTNIQLKGCHSRELIQMIRDGHIDVAVGVSPIDEDPELSITRLRDFQDVFIAGEAFRDLWDREIAPSDLTGLPLVLSGAGSSFSLHILRWFEQQKLEIRPRFSVITTAFVLPFVQSGLAVGCVPDLFARQWEQNLPVRILHLTREPPKRHVFLAVNENALLSGAGAGFIALMKEANPVWLE